jgi:hypothetical protein
LKRIATLVAGAAVLAALLAGSATAGAKPAKVAPAKVTQLQKMQRLNGQYISLTKQAKRCGVAKATLTSTGTRRTAALRKARSSSVKALKAKNTTLSRAVLGLAKAVGKCGPQTRTVQTLVPVAAGSGSAGGLVIVPSPGAPPGTVSLGLGLPTLTDSPLLDLSSVLGGDVLPGLIPAVPLDQLTSGLCTTVDAVCVGLDPALLAATLSGAVSSAPVLGPIAQPLLAQILGLLGSGDLSSLLDVQRVSDRAIRLIPRGPLATLDALLGGVLDQVVGQVGRIQIV